MKITAFAAALVLAVSAPYAAFADSVDCSGTCPDGQVMVSFADGNNASCICQNAAAMDATVADPNVHEGQVPEGNVD